VMEALRTIENAVAGIDAILTDVEHSMFDETDSAGVTALTRVAGFNARWLRQSALTEKPDDGSPLAHCHDLARTLLRELKAIPEPTGAVKDAITNAMNCESYLDSVRQDA